MDVVPWLNKKMTIVSLITPMFISLQRHGSTMPNSHGLFRASLSLVWGSRGRNLTPGHHWEFCISCYWVALQCYCYYHRFCYCYCYLDALQCTAFSMPPLRQHLPQDTLAPILVSSVCLSKKVFSQSASCSWRGRGPPCAGSSPCCSQERKHLVFHASLHSSLICYQMKFFADH